MLLSFGPYSEGSIHITQVFSESQHWFPVVTGPYFSMVLAIVPVANKE